MSVVKIKTPGEPSSGIGTIVTTDSGEPIRGVRKAVVSIEMGKAIVAELEVFSHLEATALARFMVAHPLTGEKKQVKQILFEDGTEWTA